MSLSSIDLYETNGLLLFRSKSAIIQTADLERVKEKAENIFNFYLDFNWELEFVELYLHVYSTHILPTFIIQYLRIGADKAFSRLGVVAEPVAHPGCHIGIATR